MYTRLFFLLLILPAMLGAQQPVRVFFLGGQSNMNGFGYNSELPEELNRTFENVWIFQGNPADDNAEGGGRGRWEKLRPGHGILFSSNGSVNRHSGRFGIELSFARQLQEWYPGEPIALIKYAKSGSSIDTAAARTFGCWDPDFSSGAGINQYDHFLATLRGALHTLDIDQDGQPEPLLPAGIIWMQGESDGKATEAIALDYYHNLKRLMDLFRAALHTDDLPVVIGKISDSGNGADGKVWRYGELVQYAQEKLARTDSKAAIVRQTRYYRYSDPWHYDSAAYLDLGRRFAEAWREIVNSPR